MNNQTDSVYYYEVKKSKLNKRILSARYNVGALMVMTLINIAFIFIDGGSNYFFFSASAPYYIMFFSSLYCGKMPSAIYENPENGWQGFVFYPDMIFYIAIIISVVIIAMYVICLINALKHYGWLISASVMFGIDILFLFFISFMTNTLTANAVDIIIHIVALVIFISGAVASVQKIKLEKEEATQAANTSAQITGEAENNAATAVSTDAETVETDAETVEVKAETGEASQSNNESSDIN